MKSEIAEAWASLDGRKDWVRVREQISALMPMPGSPEFDDAGKFLSLQIFPGVRAQDNLWRFPPQWTANSEVTVATLLYTGFDLDYGPHGNLADDNHFEERLAVKRFMYLLIFRPNQRPLALSTYRIYRQTLFRMLTWVNGQETKARQRSLADLSDYRLLADCISELNDVQRRTLGRIYDLLRWWRARSPSTYTFFIPPPSENALESFGDFDPLNVRADSTPRRDRSWRPLPDKFVAADGRVCLEYAEKLLPVIVRALPHLRWVRPVNGIRPATSIRDILDDVEWPSLAWQYKKPRNLTHLSYLLFACQLSVIQLLSLVIGARWSEIKSMPIDCVSSKRNDSGLAYVLDAKTFKLSLRVDGDDHQWPISGRLGRMLKMQREAAILVNGEDWPYLWFGSTRRLFDGRKPMLQVDQQLKIFARRHSLTKYLGKSKFHHHRFRKTVARLVVIALNGGPMILRELFGHTTLAMTMTYILSDPELRDELRRVAEEENKLTAKAFIDEAAELRGGGARYFNDVLDRARANLSINVPQGRKDQMRFTVNDLIDFMWSEPEGMQIKQVLPGVVGCFKPLSEEGECSRGGQTADISRCSRRCRWHLLIRERGLAMAEVSVADALQNYEGRADGMARQFWSRIIRDWVSEFPELKTKFAGSAAFTRIVSK